ncbi:hypothetical protein [Myroides injenensis]|uniref:hypothetical protein n=1 Tax=Myroides injenensis TaxID=1183151 RepID=UPI000289C344|nr:hypothetical protein [Myroides injenensis]
MKKAITSAILLLATLNISAQEKKHTYTLEDTTPITVFENKSKNTVLYLVNDTAINEGINTILPNVIKEMKVENSAIERDGIIYNSTVKIILKEDYTPELLPVHEFINKYTLLGSEPYLFAIDGKLINGLPSDVTIDGKNIMQIKVTKIDRSELLPDFYFINLITRTEDNVKKANEIKIK